MFDARALFLLQFAFFVKIFLRIGRNHSLSQTAFLIFFSTVARTRHIALHFTCKKVESHVRVPPPILSIGFNVLIPLVEAQRKPHRSAGRLGDPEDRAPCRGQTHA
jgi:hypothetical protein